MLKPLIRRCTRAALVRVSATRVTGTAGNTARWFPEAEPDSLARLGKHPRSSKDNLCPSLAKSPFSLSALIMAKRILREVEVIKHDLAAASRRRALQPRAAEKPPRGSAAGTDQPGARGCCH